MELTGVNGWARPHPHHSSSHPEGQFPARSMLECVPAVPGVSWAVPSALAVLPRVSHEDDPRMIPREQLLAPGALRGFPAPGCGSWHTRSSGNVAWSPQCPTALAQHSQGTDSASPCGPIPPADVSWQESIPNPCWGSGEGCGIDRSGRNISGASPEPL